MEDADMEMEQVPEGLTGSGEEAIVFQMGTMNKSGKPGMKAERLPAAMPAKDFTPIYSTLRTPPSGNGELQGAGLGSKLPMINHGNPTEHTGRDCSPPISSTAAKPGRFKGGSLPSTTQPRRGAWKSESNAHMLAPLMEQQRKVRSSDQGPTKAWSDSLPQPAAEPFDGQMAMRIMNKLRQVEEYMRSKQTAGSSPAGGAGDSALFNQLSSRMMELEEKLADSEAARMASQSRFEKLLQQVDKSVKQTRQEIDDGGQGRSKIKELSATASSTTAAIEKLKGAVGSMERRVQELEAAQASLVKQGSEGVKKAQMTDLEKQVQSAVSEVEKMGSKVHELDMSVQQWTRGYQSTGAAASGSAGADTSAGWASAGSKEELEALGERLMKVEAIESRVAQVEAAVQRVEVMEQRVAQVVEATQKVEEAQQQLGKRVEEAEARAESVAQSAPTQVNGGDLSAKVDSMGNKVSELAEQLPSVRAELDANISSLAAKSGASISSLSERLEQLEKAPTGSAAALPTATAAGDASLDPAPLSGNAATAAAGGLTRVEVQAVIDSSLARYDAELAAVKAKVASSTATTREADPALTATAEITPQEGDAAQSEVDAKAAREGVEEERPSGPVSVQDVEAILEERLSVYEESLMRMKEKLSDLMKSVVTRLKSLEASSAPPSTPAAAENSAEPRPMTAQDVAILQELSTKVKDLENNMLSSISHVPDTLSLSLPRTKSDDDRLAVLEARLEDLEKGSTTAGTAPAVVAGDTESGVVSEQLEALQKQTQRHAAELLTLVGMMDRVCALESSKMKAPDTSIIESRLAALETASSNGKAAYEHLGKKLEEMKAVYQSTPGQVDSSVSALIASLQSQVQGLEGQLKSVSALAGLVQRVEQLETASKKAALAGPGSLKRSGSQGGSGGGEGGEVPDAVKRSVSSSVAAATKKANERMDKIKTLLVNQIKAVEKKLEETGGGGHGGGGGGGGSGGGEDIAHLAARMDLLEPMITDFEAASNDKIDGLQAKVTSVLQLLLERVKKLEMALEGA